MVIPLYTSSFCLCKVSIAVIHGRIRSAWIEKSFSIVVRLLKSHIIHMKQNCTYFMYFHYSYFLEIKEVLVLFDKISSFCLCEDRNDYTQSLVAIPDFLFVERYYQRRVYGINILSVHSCKYRARTRMCKVQKQSNVYSTIILAPSTIQHNSDWPIPATILFCPSRYTCGFSCVFGYDTAFVVVYTIQ